MIEPDKRKAIFLLHQEGMGLREIARRFQMSRNTVRSVIATGGAMPDAVRRDKTWIDPDLLRRLYNECDGFVQRVHEKLVEEEGIDVKYSTLTRRLRALGLGRKPAARCDRVPDEPGAEMQHDTSPYTVSVAGQRVGIIASLIYLRFSKRRYLKFYRRFNRFRMKCFFHEALTYWGWTAGVCVIDNTNLARLRGTGKNAVIVPEMEAFARRYGFEFLCHEKGHPNRKAGNERGFWTVETNFFPGRRFESLEDMNAQALDWATVRMEHRAMKTGLIPAKAFEHERSALIELPRHLPAPYRVHDRVTDEYGFASFNGNYFWVPGTDRKDVRVLEYGDRLKVYRGRECLIEYALPADAVKNKRISPDGCPPPRYAPKNRRKPTVEEEKRLRALDEEVGAWLDFALKLKPAGVARHRVIRELFRMSKQMTAPLFVRSVARALKYRIDSIETLWRITHMYMSEGDATLPVAEVDEGLLARDTYVEGSWTDAPDFSTWDGMLEEDERDKDHG